jgi:hypothetical protein
MRTGRDLTSHGENIPLGTVSDKHAPTERPVMILQVPSETNANTAYAVTVDDATGVATSCTCPSARWHSGLCKHVNGANAGQEQIQYLARRARYQVAPANVALMDAIHATTSQGVGHRPTAAQVAALAGIVATVTDDPDGDVERRVLGGLLTALTARDASMLAAA